MTRSIPRSANEERSTSAQRYPATPDVEGAAVARDPSGWVYRLFAPSPECAVLEVGAGSAGNWLPNVVKGDLREHAAAGSSADRFDFVVMHYSLGGLGSLDSALASAARILRQGGVIAIAGENRLRPTTSGAARTHPRATVWGYRSALAKSGFSNVRWFVPHPVGDAPVYVIDAHRSSAQEFFRTALRDRHLPAWSPMQLVVKAIIKLNLMPYFESGFLLVGDKC